LIRLRRKSKISFAEGGRRRSGFILRGERIRKRGEKVSKKVLKKNLLWRV
jgi:hypothetical protein